MFGMGVRDGCRVRRMLSVADKGYIACNVGFWSLRLDVECMNDHG